MPDDFELDTQMLGALPVINAFIERVGLAGLLETFVPADDRRLKLAPAAALGVVVRNLAVSRRPVYALGEWAAPYDPRLLGLGTDEAGLLNDDRVGRMLARLFDADRASLLTRRTEQRCQHRSTDGSANGETRTKRTAVLTSASREHLLDRSLFTDLDP